MSLYSFLFIYLLGGITFLPILVICAILYIKGSLTPILPKRKKQEEAYPDYNSDSNGIIKKGWIRVSNQYQPKIPEFKGIDRLVSGIQSYVGSSGSSSNSSNNNGDDDIKTNKPKGLLFGVLKHGTLYLYESEKQQKEVMTLMLHDYEVSLYPKGRADYEMYARSSVIRLVPNSLLKETIENDDDNKKNNRKISADTVCTLSDEDITFYPTRVLYLTCSRKTDKEDWYFGLLQEKHQTPLEDGIMMDSTHFSPSAMENLIHQLQSSQSHLDMAWLNAIIGRLFLASYKTDKFQEYIETKVKKKVAKTKRPNFLDEIHVRKVDMGNTVPFITNPKLLSLTPEGDVIVEAQMDYSQGGLTIEIETYFNWQYTSLMKKPIRMHVILTVKLKKLSGKLMFKLKAPPTNRFWIAFFEMPDMEWEIKPVVADKQIKLAMVTNAIESRIKETMMETFVLPNMEDTPFFKSEGEGGIFGEYVKQQKQATSSSGSSIFTTSDNASVSSFPSAIRNTPSVPNLPSSTNEKQHSSAVDALKLETRRAESVSGLELSNHHSQQLLPLGAEIISQSTPELITETKNKNKNNNNIDGSSGSDSDNDKTESRSFSESIQHRWSNTILRKRHNNKKEELEGEEEGGGGVGSVVNENDTDNSHRSGSIRSSIADRLSTRAPSIASLEQRRSTENGTNNSNGSKKNALFQMAGNLLNKKNTEPDLTPLDDEKKEKYAERLTQMRKRVEQKQHQQYDQPPLVQPEEKETKEDKSVSLPEEIASTTVVSSPSLPPPLPPLPRSRSSSSSSVSASSSNLPPKKPERGIAYSEADDRSILAPVPPSLPPRHHQPDNTKLEDKLDNNNIITNKAPTPPPIPPTIPPTIPDRPKPTLASPPPLPTAPRPTITASKTISNEQNEQGHEDRQQK